MRGKVITQRPTADRFGITPAYAGKSGKDAEGKTGDGDHPRVCGEKFFTPSMMVCSRGSPPRMRGKDYRSNVRRKSPRITPAYAGKSA